MKPPKCPDCSIETEITEGVYPVTSTCPECSATFDHVSDNRLHDRYDESLDECYGTVKIAGYGYSTSRALKNVDETAYDCGFNDWLDSELTESAYIQSTDEECWEKS